LDLLQAEASACVLELANVPNVRWLFFFFRWTAKHKFFQFSTSFHFLTLHLTFRLAKYKKL